MAKLKIEEYARLPQDMHGVTMPIPPTDCIAVQVVAIDQTSAASAAFNTATRFVIVSSDLDCCIEFGVAPEATNASRDVFAKTYRDFEVTRGDKIAVIAADAPDPE
jgi:hypothetical protein